MAMDHHRRKSGISGWATKMSTRGSTNHNWLVVTGTMEFYDFPIILGRMIPTDELIFFKMVKTTNQIRIGTWSPNIGWAVRDIFLDRPCGREMRKVNAQGPWVDSWSSCAAKARNGYPLVNVHKKLWTDPPCYEWENPLFRLGHFQ